MQSTKLPKYSEFPGKDNVLIGNGELVCVYTNRGQGWITLCNHIFYDRQDAEIYATKLDTLITFNRQRLAKAKDRF